MYKMMLIRSGIVW